MGVLLAIIAGIAENAAVLSWLLGPSTSKSLDVSANIFSPPNTLLFGTSCWLIVSMMCVPYF
jgi:hypothetical protein